MSRTRTLFIVLPKRQSGVIAMLILFIVAVVAISFLVSSLKSSTSQTERDKITAAALAQAKAGLIGFAASVELSGCTSSNNCPRPGELPCPDTNDDGQAESSCGKADGSTGQVNRLGRLPWKTLGLPDLRDGYGERLWYAVSNSFKNNFRALPLNSDTLGTINVRDPNGTTIADFAAGTGAAAIIFSPGAPLTRQDGVVQDRSPSGNNNPINYLDIANGEDNQNFVDKLSNGFIQGPIKNASNSVILNDTLITISRDDIMRVVEKRVAAEVINALGSGSFPKPAAFNDSSCLGSAAILVNCNSAPSTNPDRGRIPANPSPPWGVNAGFLNGISTSWFQQNAWREVIYYTIGLLTLNNPPAAAITGRNALVIMAGAALANQNRAANKLLETNYLEDENSSSPLDDTYTIRPVISTTPFNDKVRCLLGSPPQC